MLPTKLTHYLNSEVETHMAQALKLQKILSFVNFSQTVAKKWADFRLQLANYYTMSEGGILISEPQALENLKLEEEATLVVKNRKQQHYDTHSSLFIKYEQQKSPPFLLIFG